jgi:hypothetical protein
MVQVLLPARATGASVPVKDEVRMRTFVDERLIEEVERYKLRYTCESCVHFDASFSRCSLGYPNEIHRLGPLKPRAYLIFCKEFDLV